MSTSSHKFYLLAAKAILIFLFLIQFPIGQQIHLAFDEAYDLNLIRNLSENGIYASYLNVEMILFDPAVTVGPTVTIPRAIFLHYVGLEFQDVRYVEVTWSLLLLGIGLIVVRQVLSSFPTVIFGIVIITIPFIFSYLTRVEGVFDGIVLVLISISLIIKAIRSDRMSQKLVLLFVSGASLGLAVLAKTIMGLVCIAIVVHVLEQILNHRSAQHADKLLMLIPVIMTGVLATAWVYSQSVYLRAHLTSQELQEWIQLAQSRAQLLFSRIAFSPGSHQPLVDTLHIKMFGPVLLALLLVLILRRLSSSSFLDQSGAMNTNNEYSLLVTVPFVWLSWAFFVSGPEVYVKHIIPGIVFAELLIIYYGEILYGEVLWHKYRSNTADDFVGSESKVVPISSLARQPAVQCSVITLIMLVSAIISITFSYDAIAKSSLRLSEQRQIAAWVSTNINEQAVISGWGWFVPWDIAFMSGRPAGTVDPATATPGEFEGWFIVIPEIKMTGNYDLRLTEFLRDHASPFHAMGDYDIYRLE